MRCRWYRRDPQKILIPRTHSRPRGRSLSGIYRIRLRAPMIPLNPILAALFLVNINLVIRLFRAGLLAAPVWTQFPLLDAWTATPTWHILRGRLRRMRQLQLDRLVGPDRKPLSVIAKVAPPLRCGPGIDRELPLLAIPPGPALAPALAPLRDEDAEELPDEEALLLLLNGILLIPILG